MSKIPPSKASIGDLYEIFLDVKNLPKDHFPEFFVFDVSGNEIASHGWIYKPQSVGLVLDQQPKFTSLLVNEMIIHLSDYITTLYSSRCPIWLISIEHKLAE